MNNIQELYKTQRFLIAIKHNSVSNYSKMINVSEDENGVHITLAEDINKNLKADEKKKVITMIYGDLRRHDERSKIEGKVIADVEKQLKECKEQVREDIGMDDIFKKKMRVYPTPEIRENNFDKCI